MGKSLAKKITSFSLPLCFVGANNAQQMGYLLALPTTKARILCLD
jgi:hypothetical protein